MVSWFFLVLKIKTLKHLKGSVKIVISLHWCTVVCQDMYVGGVEDCLLLFAVRYHHLFSQKCYLPVKNKSFVSFKQIGWQVPAVDTCQTDLPQSDSWLKTLTGKSFLTLFCTRHKQFMHHFITSLPREGKSEGSLSHHIRPSFFPSSRWATEHHWKLKISPSTLFSLSLLSTDPFTPHPSPLAYGPIRFTLQKVRPTEKLKHEVHNNHVRCA